MATDVVVSGGTVHLCHTESEYSTTVETETTSVHVTHPRRQRCCVYSQCGCDTAYCIASSQEQDICYATSDQVVDVLPQSPSQVTILAKESREIRVIQVSQVQRVPTGHQGRGLCSTIPHHSSVLTWICRRFLCLRHPRIRISRLLLRGSINLDGTVKFKRLRWTPRKPICWRYVR